MVESPVVDGRRQMRVIRGGSEFERSTTSHFLLVVSSLRGLGTEGEEEGGGRVGDGGAGGRVGEWGGGD